MVRRSTRPVCAVLAVMGVTTLAGAAPAWAAPSAFTPGDLVVYEVGTVGGATPSATSAPVSLWDYSAAGVPSGFVVTFPSTVTKGPHGATHALVDAGTATDDGELTVSGDGQFLYATGYDDNAGVADVTTVPGIGRMVGIVSGTGVMDTSTVLTDATTEGPSDGPNALRSATGTTGASGSFYTGGQGGLGAATDGASGATYLNTTAVHQVLISDGQLYASTPAGVVAVGSGLPSTAPQTDTALVPSPPPGSDPDGFAFATLGPGSSPDTLYVADTGAGHVEKYSLVDGTWTLEGAVPVPEVEGIAVRVSAGVASIYVTDATTTSAPFDSVLSELTDSSGPGGTLTSPVTTLASAPSGEAFKSLAFAPGTPPADTPEAPAVAALPALGGLVVGAVVLARRERRRRAA
ncbi:MAG: hypothetical protein ABSG81_11370 [Acidimicrobiales bacterium]